MILDKNFLKKIEIKLTAILKSYGFSDRAPAIERLFIQPQRSFMCDQQRSPIYIYLSIFVLSWSGGCIPA